jgi:hypothetical protein
LTGANKSSDEMPVLYEKVRLEMARSGLDHENYMAILKAKISVLGGMNFISPENINKANSNRTENFNKFIESCYPYIELKKPEQKKNKTTEELINEYKKMFPIANTPEQS